MTRLPTPLLLALSASREPARPSNSSKKTMAGAAALALHNGAIII